VVTAHAFQPFSERSRAKVRPTRQYTSGGFSRGVRVDDDQSVRQLRVYHVCLPILIRTACCEEISFSHQREGESAKPEDGASLPAPNRRFLMGTMLYCKVYKFGYNRYCQVAEFFCIKLILRVLRSILQSGGWRWRFALRRGDRQQRDG
jgi:hypothetical protein